MFTGIIEGRGRVKSVEKAGSSGKIKVEAPFSLSSFTLGDSIAVDGVCLTVSEVAEDSFTADISGETLSLTTLGALKPGDGVNLEPALTLAKPLGGHLVTGHIDGVGALKRREESGGNVEIEFSLPKALSRQLVKKGSVAVDGISLTVAFLSDESFRVAVIPITLKKTTLGEKKDGASVNIETDIIGKYVEKFLKKGTAGESDITEGFLREHGFLGGE